jgi:hypothetical protein
MGYAVELSANQKAMTTEFLQKLGGEKCKSPEKWMATHHTKKKQCRKMHKDAYRTLQNCHVSIKKVDGQFFVDDAMYTFHLKVKPVHFTWVVRMLKE